LQALVNLGRGVEDVLADLVPQVPQGLELVPDDLPAVLRRVAVQLLAQLEDGLELDRLAVPEVLELTQAILLVLVAKL